MFYEETKVAKVDWKSGLKKWIEKVDSTQKKSDFTRSRDSLIIMEMTGTGCQMMDRGQLAETLQKDRSIIGCDGKFT